MPRVDPCGSPPGMPHQAPSLHLQVEPLSLERSPGVLKYNSNLTWKASSLGVETNRAPFRGGRGFEAHFQEGKAGEQGESDEVARAPHLCSVPAH